MSEDRDVWRRLQALEKRIDEWREGQNAVLHELAEIRRQIPRIRIEIAQFEAKVNEKLQTWLIEPVKMTGLVKKKLDNDENCPY